MSAPRPPRQPRTYTPFTRNEYQYGSEDEYFDEDDAKDEDEDDYYDDYESEDEDSDRMNYYM